MLYWNVLTGWALERVNGPPSSWNEEVVWQTAPIASTEAGSVQGRGWINVVFLSYVSGSFES